jgi:hypothetical protein
LRCKIEQLMLVSQQLRAGILKCIFTQPCIKIMIRIWILI